MSSAQYRSGSRSNVDPGNLGRAATPRCGPSAAGDCLYTDASSPTARQSVCSARSVSNECLISAGRRTAVAEVAQRRDSSAGLSCPVSFDDRVAMVGRIVADPDVHVGGGACDVVALARSGAVRSPVASNYDAQQSARAAGDMAQPPGSLGLTSPFRVAFVQVRTALTSVGESQLSTSRADPPS